MKKPSTCSTLLQAVSKETRNVTRLHFLPNVDILVRQRAGSKQIVATAAFTESAAQRQEQNQQEKGSEQNDHPSQQADSEY